VWSVVIFTVLASLTVVTAVAATLVLGERIRTTLDATREWLVANNNTILIVLFTVFAAVLIGRGLGVFD
jgi:cytosine/uracil/thiamine/allantoin permease